ncbi:membrane-spanning 4-domains subfamily A member 12 isoform X2 [Mesocricetus auratus]|uniref:Membrane-spanning 4-domains subfamily A member 12 isoform X2 n=1 Tax=Mesocricetus auratus TaxID=10036 RepID=A0ABM2XKM2_MESAU|nr:membrane-spanning 4-domains subfamily A member 12 isoform X2 [Mesocricetus auratus]
MMSSWTTTYPGMHVTIPNPCPPTHSKALHHQQPLDFLNVGSQVQTEQHSFITSPGIFTTNQLGLENVPMAHSGPGTTATKTNFKDATIALGAVHIIIGLVHIGFGVVLGLLSTHYYMSWAFYSIAFIGGYPFWGGVSFIASGSLSISAFKKFTPCLLSGRGIAGALAILSVLEFGVACAMTHFANQTMLHGQGNRTVPTAPTMYVANPLMQESFPDPPIYDNIPAYAPRQ